MVRKKRLKMINISKKCIFLDTTFYLIKKDKFIIGRKNCDFLITNDQSISKEHASICIKVSFWAK